MLNSYNSSFPAAAVKRLMKEAQELRESTEQYFAQPLEDNLFEWHFTIRGPVDSEFDGGVYHGRITLPPEYPMKPPSIMLLTVSTSYCNTNGKSRSTAFHQFWKSSTLSWISARGKAMFFVLENHRKFTEVRFLLLLLSQATLNPDSSRVVIHFDAASSPDCFPPTLRCPSHTV